MAIRAGLFNACRPWRRSSQCLSRASWRLWTIAGAIGSTALVIGGVLLFRFLNEPVPKMLRLTDGTEVFFLSDSTVEPARGFPRPREIRVDGEAFLRASDGPRPLILRSRLLVLTVSGATDLRIVAHANESGEQVEVLRGNVVARKSYPSNYSEPDVLTGGDMTMINRDIDLMEKEKCDVVALRAWSEALRASVPAR